MGQHSSSASTPPSLGRLSSRAAREARSGPWRAWSRVVSYKRGGHVPSTASDRDPPTVAATHLAAMRVHDTLCLGRSGAVAPRRRGGELWVPSGALRSVQGTQETGRRPRLPPVSCPHETPRPNSDTCSVRRLDECHVTRLDTATIFRELYGGAPPQLRPHRPARACGPPVPPPGVSSAHPTVRTLRLQRPPLLGCCLRRRGRGWRRRSDGACSAAD
jgi:hypothetical protein